jgi:ubiquitin-like modifier-activating enzyme ATG7
MCRVASTYTRAEGIIRNLNTIEDFKNANKVSMMANAGKQVGTRRRCFPRILTGLQIWEAIKDGTIYSVPSLLSSFVIISFADLKKYRFTMWAGFPALHSNPTWRHSTPIERINGIESTALVDEVNAWQYRDAEGRQRGFFLLKKIPKQGRAEDSRRNSYEEAEHNAQDSLPYEWKAAQLRDFETGFFDDVEAKDQYIGFSDPSTYPENPGWMLRNLLVLIRYRFRLNKVQIMCYRDTHSKREEARSIIMHLESPDVEVADMSTAEMPKVTGWERNNSGKLAPKVMDLSQHMDPRHLADQSVDLNLKLMKWRIAPNLDLQKIKDTKCLLLGAGTLGSYVSRNLLGWGVRHITFVDNATVSFSNPVRQPLFNYNDCLNGGVKKAPRASEALREIYPGVETAGHAITVPMLGHAIMDEEKTKNDFELLQKLVEEHDAIFLLMDTRESRWLPTLMAKAAGKIVLNAALGFDTYVVMRHGLIPPEGGDAELGCYFCNDVVAPADSVKDQTLDQQCTVTRPGIAAMASAQLVELLVSILQHPGGALAPGPKTLPGSTPAAPSYARDPPEHPLGVIPHQIRGFLATWQNMLITGQSYDCCSACSQKVVDAYKEGGWKFVKRALGEKDYITELSGLAEVQRQAEKASADVDWLSEDEGDSGDGEGELI